MELQYEIKHLMPDGQAHDISHTMAVYHNSIQIADKEAAPVNRTIMGIIALCHDADDYKLFGQNVQNNLTNTRNILQKLSKTHNLPPDLIEYLCRHIATIGFSKRRKHIFLSIPESKIVSDADMLEASGINGILRIKEYCDYHHRPFFDPDIFPKNDIIIIQETQQHYTGIGHIFEKILKLDQYMLTETGRTWMKQKKNDVIYFLTRLFTETNHPEWQTYLNDYLQTETSS